MSLPDAHGIDVLRRLKTDPATQPMPVIVVSADTIADHLREALRPARWRTSPNRSSGRRQLEKIDRALEAPVA